MRYYTVAFSLPPENQNKSVLLGTCVKCIVVLISNEEDEFRAKRDP